MRGGGGGGSAPNNGIEGLALKVFAKSILRAKLSECKDTQFSVTILGNQKKAKARRDPTGRY